MYKVTNTREDFYKICHIASNFHTVKETSIYKFLQECESKIICGYLMHLQKLNDTISDIKYLIISWRMLLKDQNVGIRLTIQVAFLRVSLVNNTLLIRIL